MIMNKETHRLSYNGPLSDRDIARVMKELSWSRTRIEECLQSLDSIKGMRSRSRNKLHSALGGSVTLHQESSIVEVIDDIARFVGCNNTPYDLRSRVEKARQRVVHDGRGKPRRRIGPGGPASIRPGGEAAPGKKGENAPAAVGPASVTGVQPGFSLATRTAAEARAICRSLWDLGGGEERNRGYLVPPVHPRVLALRQERF